MLDLAEHDSLASLAEQIDELSTRLILNGAATLRPADFDDFRRSAAASGLVALEQAAQGIAETVAACDRSSLSISDLTRSVSSGLVQLRSMCDEPEVHATQLTPTSEKFDNADASPGKRTDEKPLAADEELIREFITESTEHLATIESQLLILENNDLATEALNSIFRGFHTIKGLAGFLEFTEIQALTHEVETLLDLARTAQLVVDPNIVDVLLESTDVIRQELVAIEQKLAGTMRLPTRVDSALLQRVRLAYRQIAAEPESEHATALIASDPKACSAQERQPVREERRASDASSVRIDTTKLDQLMDMVGEMVIAQTLIQHSKAMQSVADATLQRNLTQLTRITADVQRITTGMRMVPIGQQFNKTARMVRDLARRAGKAIVFGVSGEDTELDKNIAEQLADPLLHMVRNSIDHGIESAEERLASGKDPIAHIRVSAQHQSGQILVTVADDGRGLDRARILAKAIQKGLVAPGAQLTDNEIFYLIFEPGFTTAETVTDISGRGVGMDVVRKHVQKLRGRIDIQSKPGEGTTFSIKLPLTLAIIDGLIVVVGHQRYIIPIFSVREMLRPTPEMLSTVQQTVEMALVRGALLPIVRLHRRFAIEPRVTSLTEGTLIVTESNGRPFCLFVDDLIGKQEVVIKSLGRRFKDVAGVAGCAILGDGRVGLILDIDGIYRGKT